MSTFEVIWTVIWTIILLIMVAIPLFSLIAGLVKREIDKEEKGNTGIVGWV